LEDFEVCSLDALPWSTVDAVFLAILPSRLCLYFYICGCYRPAELSAWTVGEIGRRKARSRKVYFGRRSQRWSSDDSSVSTLLTV